MLCRPEIRQAPCAERRRRGNGKAEGAGRHVTRPAFAERLEGVEIRVRNARGVFLEEGFVFEGLDGPAVRQERRFVREERGFDRRWHVRKVIRQCIGDEPGDRLGARQVDERGYSVRKVAELTGRRLR